jgi:acetyl-CoA carboxylase biotin carboxylase subunit
VVPGSEGSVSDSEAAAVANRIGFPVLVKAAAGGGGKGMRVANSAAELAQAVNVARKEAKANFGDETIYLEKYLSHPRHIEIQILADGHGNVVHLGERDCSLQRRHQKVLEEAPSPALNANQRAEIGHLAADAMKRLGYRSAGTIEFLYQDGAFYFIEMNTRLQVEHPVTEMITGIDLVREQIRVATGAPLAFTQQSVSFNGHAIECRINAENPQTFMPSPGRVSDYHAPGGLGVRVDSALYAGYHVPPTYDSLIAKLIVHGSSRNECLMRLRRALEEFVIGGIDTTIPLHQRLIAAPEFIDGAYDIRWLEKFVDTR